MGRKKDIDKAFGPSKGVASMLDTSAAIKQEGDVRSLSNGVDCVAAPEPSGTAPMFLYVTRPNAYEIYMGGWRDMRVWTEEPSYYHTPSNFDVYYGTNEIGWQGPNQLHGSKAKGLLRDDPLVGERIWELVFWSLLPKGMTDVEGQKWWKTEGVHNGRRDINWCILIEDREWEAKCNLCHKRFLLKVDVRSGSMELITPYVYLPNFFPRGERNGKTLECEGELATRLKVGPDEQEIPW